MHTERFGAVARDGSSTHRLHPTTSALAQSHPVEDDTRTPTDWHHASRDTDADLNPAALGVLGLVFGVVSIMLALTGYLTLLALLGAAIALVLGVLALGDDRSRGFGVGAIAVGAVALLCAAVVLASLG
jgi:hypothetical protein